jgi:hypothetical protein
VERSYQPVFKVLLGCSEFVHSYKNILQCDNRSSRDLCRQCFNNSTQFPNPLNSWKCCVLSLIAWPVKRYKGLEVFGFNRSVFKDTESFRDVSLEIPFFPFSSDVSQDDEFFEVFMKNSDWSRGVLCFLSSIKSRRYFLKSLFSINVASVYLRLSLRTTGL